MPDCAEIKAEVTEGHVRLPAVLEDGYNEIELISHDVEKRSVYLSTGVWIGSKTLRTDFPPPKDGSERSRVVALRLTDRESMTRRTLTKRFETSSGSFTIPNVPTVDGILRIDWVGADGSTLFEQFELNPSGPWTFSLDDRRRWLRE